MHEAVDAAGQADEHAEVGDRLDLARHLVATVEVLGELLPRVRLALLDAERDAAALFVDVEHHDFDFLARVHDLGRVDVLVGPVHFGHVHQAFDAVFDLDERAVVGDVRDLAEQARARRVAARDVLPRILAELLEAQRNAVLSRSNLRMRTSISSPTLTTSDGCLTRLHAMSVMCSRPSMPPRSTNAP